MLANILIVGALIVFGLIAFRNRVHAIALVLFFLPLYIIRFSVGPIPSTLLEGMILVLFVVWVVEKKGIAGVLKFVNEKISKASRQEKMLYFFLYLFVMSATVSVAFSPEPRAALGIWRAYFIEPALFFLVFIDTIKTRAHMARLISASIFSGTIIAAVAVYQKITGWNIPAPWIDERRVTSIYPYPNAVGLYLAPIVWLAFWRARAFFQEKKNLQTILFCAAALLMVVSIYFSKTEAALVALLAVAGGFGLLWNARTRIITLVIIALGAFFIFSSPTISGPVTEKILLRDWSGIVRIKTWKETAEMLKDYSITGAGLAGYQKTFEKYHTRTYIEIFLYPHNIILNFWSEIGLYGLISFILVCAGAFVLLRAAARASPQNRFFTYMLGAAFATILIHGLVDAPYFKNDLSLFFWALLGCAVIMRNKKYAA